MSRRQIRPDPDTPHLRSLRNRQDVSDDLTAPNSLNHTIFSPPYHTNHEIMASSSPPPSFSKPPIFLLKTKSTPHDGYEEYFSSRGYDPTFVPVLEHRFHDENLKTVKELFVSGQLDEGSERKYGGLIFTSQRAVEGFVRAVEEVGGMRTFLSSLFEAVIIYPYNPLFCSVRQFKYPIPLKTRIKKKNKPLTRSQFDQSQPQQQHPNP